MSSSRHTSTTLSAVVVAVVVAVAVYASPAAAQVMLSQPAAAALVRSGEQAYSNCTLMLLRFGGSVVDAHRAEFGTLLAGMVDGARMLTNLAISVLPARMLLPPQVTAVETFVTDYSNHTTFVKSTFATQLVNGTNTTVFNDTADELLYSAHVLSTWVQANLQQK